MTGRPPRTAGAFPLSDHSYYGVAVVEAVADAVPVAFAVSVAFAVAVPVALAVELAVPLAEVDADAPAVGVAPLTEPGL